MNTKQLQYALKLSKSLNFSHVAEELNISQPALSKQILHLENDLGIKLFDRSTTPLTLTPAGEHFIQKAEDLLYQEEQLLRSMEQFKSGEAGRLTIGISPFRSLYMIPPILKELRKKYPGIQICLREANSDTLRKEAAEGKYDFALANLPVDDSLLDISLLEPDKIVLAVPNQLLSEINTESQAESNEISLSQCQNLPFIVVGPSQEMRILFDKLCCQSGFHPQIAMEVVGLTTAWSMCHAGIGATLLPLQFLNTDKAPENVTLFKIKNNHYTRQPAIVSRKGQFLSEYAKYAIQLLNDMYKK